MRCGNRMPKADLNSDIYKKKSSTILDTSDSDYSPLPSCAVPSGGSGVVPLPPSSASSVHVQYHHLPPSSPLQHHPLQQQQRQQLRHQQLQQRLQLQGGATAGRVKFSGRSEDEVSINIVGF